MITKSKGNNQKATWKDKVDFNTNKSNEYDFISEDTSKFPPIAVSINRTNSNTDLSVNDGHSILSIGIKAINNAYVINYISRPSIPDDILCAMLEAFLCTTPMDRWHIFDHVNCIKNKSGGDHIEDIVRFISTLKERAPVAYVASITEDANTLPHIFSNVYNLKPLQEELIIEDEEDIIMCIECGLTYNEPINSCLGCSRKPTKKEINKWERAFNRYGSEITIATNKHYFIYSNIGKNRYQVLRAHNKQVDWVMNKNEIESFIGTDKDFIDDHVWKITT